MRVSGTHPEFLRIRGASLKLRSLRNPQLRELRFDIAIHVVFAEVVCDANGILDRIRIGAAMTNDSYSVDTQQRRSAILRIIETAPKRAECFLREDVSDLGGESLLQFLAEH